MAIWLAHIKELIRLLHAEISGQVKFGQENEIIVKTDNTARPDVIPVKPQPVWKFMEEFIVRYGWW